MVNNFIFDNKFENRKKLELVEMIIDNFNDEGISAQAAMQRLTDIFDNNLDEDDIEFLEN